MNNMNEHILERFRRGTKPARGEREQAAVWILPQKLNLKVRQYFDEARRPVDGGLWLNRPEIPTSGEVLDIETNGSSSSGVVEIVPNKLNGAWESKGQPLSIATSLSHSANDV